MSCGIIDYYFCLLFRVLQMSKPLDLSSACSSVTSDFVAQSARTKDVTAQGLLPYVCISDTCACPSSLTGNGGTGALPTLFSSKLKQPFQLQLHFAKTR